MSCHARISGRGFVLEAHRSRRLRRRAARQRIWAFRPRWEAMEDRTLLATMNWINPAGGDWDTASNWVNTANSSDHHVPTSSDDAVINFTGATVTHASGTSDSIDSLTSQASINLSNGSLSLAT